MFIKKLLALATAILIAVFLAPYLAGQELGRTSLVEYAPGSLIVIPSGAITFNGLLRYKLSAPSRAESVGSVFGFQFKDLEPATYTVTVESATHRGAGTVTVVPGGEAVVRISLSAIQPNTQVVRILVREAKTREPVSDVRVGIGDGGFVTTDSEGGATFMDVQCQTRSRISVQRGNKTIAQRAMYVSPAASASYEIVLGMTEDIAVAQGLQAWYPLNETDPFLDAGPFGRHAERTTTTEPRPAVDRFGMEGGAIWFDQKTSAIVIPDQGWQNQVPLSVSFWLKTDPKTESTAMFFGKYLHPSGDGWLVFYEDRLLCAAHISSRFKHYSRVNTRTSVDNKWHHIVITINESALVMYVDGARVPANTSDVSMAGVTSKEPIILGRLQSTLWPKHTGLVGAMDDVAFYNRILTDEEILLLGR